MIRKNWILSLPLGDGDQLASAYVVIDSWDNGVVEVGIVINPVGAAAEAGGIQIGLSRFLLPLRGVDAFFEHETTPEGDVVVPISPAPRPAERVPSSFPGGIPPAPREGGQDAPGGDSKDPAVV